jgi:hypothetical protein
VFEKENNFEVFISDFEKISMKNKEKNKMLRKIKNKELLSLLKISSAIFIIHDRRKEYMIQAISYLELFLNEIAIRYNIPLSDLHYIRVSELEKLPDILPELKKRREHSVFFLFPKEEITVLSGAEAKNILKKLIKRWIWILSQK